MILVNGYIKNQSGQPIPGATVQVINGDFNLTGQGTAANAMGFFSFYINEFNEPYGLSVSSVGYKPTVVSLSTFTNGNTITLATNVIELPPVVVTSDKNKNIFWLIIAAAVLLLLNKK